MLLQKWAIIFYFANSDRICNKLIKISLYIFFFFFFPVVLFFSLFFFFLHRERRRRRRSASILSCTSLLLLARPPSLPLTLWRSRYDFFFPMTLLHRLQQRRLSYVSFLALSFSLLIRLLRWRPFPYPFSFASSAAFTTTSHCWHRRRGGHYDTATSERGVFNVAGAVVIGGEAWQNRL